MNKVLPLLFLFFISQTNSQTVNTQFGTIQGSLNGTVYQFLGIPFAKPPINDLRWKAPQNPVNWTGILTTNAFSPVCPQKNFDTGGSSSTIEGNEDCLYLNIWTPNLTNTTKPVMVFIHGGGNQQGSTSEVNGGTQMFFGKNLADRGNAVIVTIQYRLGPLGFLVHPGLETENVNNVSGNYAVMDQILALRWIQNNIANFGGDVNKIMIFGESAGGINVGNLLTSPLAANLFQRACIESAAPVINNYSTGRNLGIDYVNTYTTTGTDTDKIAYMRSLTSDQLVANETAPLSGGAVGLNWLPVVDNVVFNSVPSAQFQSGNFNKVPLIIGSNSEEMSISAPETVTPLMVTLLKNSIVPTALLPQANSLYPSGADNTTAKQSYIGILTDSQFTASTRRTAQCVSSNQTEPVWRYFFTHKHTVSILQPLGSYHGMELFYVFNNWENATLGSGPLFHNEDEQVQDAMLSYWVNFANTGNPNGTGLATWPQYNAATDCYVEIKATPDGTQCGLRTAKTDLWDAAINYTPCTSSLSVVENNDTMFTVFPNPLNDIVNIIPKGTTDSIEISVFDLTGKKLFTSTELQLDFSNYSSGIYTLKINQGNTTSTAKIIKK
ncbi:carboxylesterase family protein [Flavobacterium paronense]|uniref:Carboxylic ester hydrolase n=1 Tax=Flavobacterium paronense TaxID=1392775 RepID=A0ABV5GD60_9FLAO|nr:carboxylesterase family protein [Flavobacterium paronense]MDN3677563.1 carboxylesterase family protein [Flavobacterium paronense]